MRTCHCVSNFKKMYGEGPLTFLMAASGDTETLLSKTQYGFRPNRSTSHAMYVLRRIQDYSDIKGANLRSAFLDWEKALDKIQHDKLIIALHRLGFNSHYTDVIADCYRNPQFFVQDNFGCSDRKVQSSGIRQGCPLSPFLFVLVMTCIDWDIQQAGVLC